MTILNGLLDLFLIQAALLVFGILSVYLAFQKQRVVILKPLRLPKQSGEAPPNEGRRDKELTDLGFHWIGDFDASCMDDVVILTRFYATADLLHYVMIASLSCESQRLSVLEFSTELSPKGNVSTSNIRQPSSYAYRSEKLVVHAPWKRTAADLFALHLELCDAAAQCGFSPRPVASHDWASQIADESRLDMEGEVARGRMRRVSADTYQKTFKGALFYTPIIWVNMTYGLLFAWRRPANRKLTVRAQQRFAWAMRQIGSVNYAPEGP